MKEQLRKLSASEVLQLEKMANELEQEMLLEDFNQELTKTLCDCLISC